MSGLALDVQRTHAFDMATRKTKAPGRNISDAERNTTKITLRLDPETAEDLKTFSEKAKIPMSAVVDACFTAMHAAGAGSFGTAEEVSVYFEELLHGTDFVSQVLGRKGSRKPTPHQGDPKEGKAKT